MAERFHSENGNNASEHSDVVNPVKYVHPYLLRDD